MRAVAAGSVTTSSTSPAAVMATPAHWRGPTSKPKIRSASTASITTPVESTACTTDSGASASAATCSSQAPSGDAHADREPLGAEQRRAAAQRMADVDRGRLVRATVLVEEAELGRDRAAEREQDAEIQAQVKVSRVGVWAPAHARIR